jgi:FKBP-type peptidyl-prolyl cis-trans isomerase (trigger factor)
MSQKATSYTTVTTKNLDASRIEITGTVAPELWMKHRQTALKHINESITLDGFRKGMIPESILVSKIGETAILEEMAELAISQAYIDIIVDNTIDAIGQPNIQVTKLAHDNPLEFTATTAVMPHITLPDYKKLATDEMSKTSTDEIAVTDAEVEDAIVRIRKSRVSHEGHNHDAMTAEEHDQMVTDAIPELTDEFVKSLGKFADVADFKKNISNMVLEEKKNASNEKRRIRIADAITLATTVELPSIMIDSELSRTEAQFKSDIERMGATLVDYLKHAKKTIEDLRTEWRPHAEKKAKLQLILNKIAKVEKLAPSAQEIETEVGHIVEHYKDADRERATVYAETVLTNEKVFQFLEGAKK